MSTTLDVRTGIFLAALACMVFGFVPLFILAMSAGLELLWLLASGAQSLADPSTGIAGYVAGAADKAFSDWADLYAADGRFDASLFAAQCLCALLWCVYLQWLRRPTSSGRLRQRPSRTS